MVAPGVALVARDVVALEDREELMKSVMQGTAGFICTAITSAGLTIWRPRQVTLIDNTDLAILTVEGASALPEVLCNGTISTRLPKVGERIVIAGLPRHEYKAEGGRANLNVRMVVATGWSRPSIPTMNRRGPSPPGRPGQLLKLIVQHWEE